MSTFQGFDMDTMIAQYRGRTLANLFPFLAIDNNMLAFEFSGKVCNLLMRASTRGRNQIGGQVKIFLNTHIEKHRRSGGADKTGKLWYSNFSG